MEVRGAEDRAEPANDPALGLCREGGYVDRLRGGVDHEEPLGVGVVRDDLGRPLVEDSGLEPAELLEGDVLVRSGRALEAIREAPVELLHVEKQQEVCGAEARIPGGLAADVRAQAKVRAQERGQASASLAEPRFSSEREGVVRLHAKLRGARMVSKDPRTDVPHFRLVAPVL